MAFVYIHWFRATRLTFWSRFQLAESIYKRYCNSNNYTDCMNLNFNHFSSLIHKLSECPRDIYVIQSVLLGVTLGSISRFVWKLIRSISTFFLFHNKSNQKSFLFDRIICVKRQRLVRFVCERTWNDLWNHWKMSSIKHYFVIICIVIKRCIRLQICKQFSTFISKSPRKCAQIEKEFY